jgi:translocator protein
MPTTTTDRLQRPRPLPAWAVWTGLALFLALAYAAGGVGSLLQGGDVGARYQSFDRPAWAPPPAAFGIVWPVLYTAIGVAGWRVWREARRLSAAPLALGLWAVQLVLNAVWPGVFFGEDLFGWALALIVLLDVVVLATILAFRRIDRPAAWLLVPYLAWLLFATALNAALLLRN